MESDRSVPIEGHIESTIYVREGREWISLHGKEVPVYDYRPGSSSTPIKVVLRGEKYYTIGEVPIGGIYTGDDIMERISHDISSFCTRLKYVFSNTYEIDIKEVQALSDGVINALHACGMAIEQEQSKAREALLDHEPLQYDYNKATQELKASNNERGRIEKKSNALAKAVKYLLQPSATDLPLLHQLCSEKDVFLTDFIKENKLDVHQRAKYSIFDEIGFCDFEAVSPIYIAAISGNVTTMQELYDLDSSIFNGLSGDEKYKVVGAAAYGSFECFELAKSWLNPKEQLPSAQILCEKESLIPLMAARGGNLEVLRSLIPDPSRFSVAEFFTDPYWREFFSNAFIGGILDWLVLLEHANLLLSEDLFAMVLSRMKGNLIPLDSLKWMLANNFPPKSLLTTEVVQEASLGSTTFLNYMAKCGRLDILDWLSLLPGFSLTARDSKGSTLMQEACYTNSVGVLEWAFTHPSCKQEHFHIKDTNGNHMVHIAAEHGSLDCLKWICEKVTQFQHIRGSGQLLSILGHNSLTVLHEAAISCDVPTLQWLHSHHMANFSSAPRDEKGRFPIHYASKRAKALEWMVDVAKCDLTARDADGVQPIHYAVHFNDITAVGFILSRNGPDCLSSRTIKAGRCPVHFITSEAMGEYLLKHGVDLNKRSSDGFTLYRLKPLLQPWLDTKGIRATTYSPLF